MTLKAGDFMMGASLVQRVTDVLDLSAMGTVALIDGSSYLFRAYYAIQPLTNSKGVPTHVILGFTNMLLKVLAQLKPEYVAVIWDNPDGSFRDKMFEGYKANRDVCPEDLASQIPSVREMVQALGFYQINHKGFEADDVIATWAEKARRKHKVVIISSDKDLTQLVDGNVVIWDTMRDREYNSASVKEKFGVGPDRMRDYLALVGDSSDNIPGVRGIGPKSAVKLLEEFGSFDGIFKALPSMKEGRTKELLKASEENAKMSYELVKLVDTIEVEGDVSLLKPQPCDQSRLHSLLEKLELKNILQRVINMGLITPKSEQQTFALEMKSGPQPQSYRVVRDIRDLDNVIGQIEKEGRLGFWAPSSGIGEFYGFALSIKKDQGWFIPSVSGTPDGLNWSDAASKLERVFQDRKIARTTYDLKRHLSLKSSPLGNLTVTGTESGVVESTFDVMVAAYLVDAIGRIDVASLALKYCGREVPDFEAKGKEAIKLKELSSEQMAHVTCSISDVVLQMTDPLRKSLRELSADKLYEELESPLIPILAQMERFGVTVDVKFLKKMQTQLEEDASDTEKQIYKLAGHPFTIQSPKQLGEILFKELKLPTKRKTKTGYSTDVDVLEELSKQHPLPEKILEYREIMKLKSTYVDALLELKDDADRVHTSFNQTVTATGRLSSSDPNLQNIPIRTERGKKIRQAFVASDGCELVIADYSQIELRLMAHYSQDARMIDAFSKQEDIHAQTASLVFGVPLFKVSKDQRRMAKAINFGLIYGQSAFGLSQQLGIPQTEAKELIDQYFKTYASVKKCMDDLVSRARKCGYAETLLGRRRYLPDLKSKNRMKVGFAERTAINTPLQGSAADIIKKAMLDLNSALKDLKGARLILQVHDELIVECPASKASSAKAMVKSAMEGAMKLRVPLEVTADVGRNWGAKD